jgi:hypothetical protein|tara:strand:+ start:315 stop:560 length:246 start_codon:yes stop_codon:yes gene_type:complete
MTRAEYELVYSAIRSYRVYMTDAEEVLSEKILDDLFYPSFDALSEKTGQELEDMVDSDYDESGERSDTVISRNGVKSLNFR